MIWPLAGKRPSGHGIGHPVFVDFVSGTKIEMLMDVIKSKACIHSGEQKAPKSVFGNLDLKTGRRVGVLLK